MDSITVLTAGRTDLEDFFRLSGLVTATRLTHTPFLAFVAEGTTVQVRIFENAGDLVTVLADDTRVMVQWPGQWRSDFFQMTVADIRPVWEAHRARHLGLPVEEYRASQQPRREQVEAER